MKIFNKTIEFQTQKLFDFIDITEKIVNILKEGQIKNGLINIQTFHTTTAIFVNENEPLLLEDIKDNLNRLAPTNLNYRHDDLTIRTVNLCDNECINGHSHCKAIYLPTNVVLNIIDSKIQLGQWQRIFFAELDRAKKRMVQIQAIGE